MIKLNKNLLRSMFTIAIATLFGASALFLNAPSASMQSGSNTIVFERRDTTASYTKIFTMNADGTNVVDLGRGFGPSWSPDGSRIAFATGTTETSDIWIMNADGSDRQQITQNWNSYGPAWSPDGSKIAFVSYHEGGAEHVYLVNIDGSGQQRLIHNAVGVNREYAPAWSADGSGVIFLGKKVINGLSSYDYYRASASNNGDTLQITDLNNLFDIVPAAVSPDGTQIIVEYQHDLQTVTTDGTGSMMNLTPGGTQGSLTDPNYAPNGTKIVYTDGPAIWVMDADGSNAVSLGVNGSHPDWNPTAVLPGPTPTPTPDETPTPTPTPAETPTPTPTPAVAVDIAVQASASALSVPVGSEVTYTVNVSNVGSSDSSDTVLISSPLTSLAPISVQSTVGTCVFTNGGILCSIGALDAGSSAAVTFVGRVTAAGAISLQFGGGTADVDVNLANNSAEVVVNGLGPCATPLHPPYEVRKIDWKRHDNRGQDELILSIRNISGHALDPRFIVVFQSLPNDVTIEPGQIAGYTTCSTPVGSPYVVQMAPNGREWKDNQTLNVRVVFNNPSRNGIPFLWRFYTGPVNP